MHSGEQREYIDTTGFFQYNIPLWEKVFRDFSVSTYLEVGTCEGASLFWLANRFAQSRHFQATIIDDWKDFHEEGESRYFKNFKQNLEIAQNRFGRQLSVEINRGVSKQILPKLIAMGRASTYDLVYIDGDHTASNVLIDCSLGFDLLRVGGLMIIDDYTWGYGGNPTELPKIAIDSFLTCFAKLLKLIYVSNQQIIVSKVKDIHFEGQ